MAIAESRWDVDASELRAQAARCRRLAARTTDRKSADTMRSIADLCDAALAAMSGLAPDARSMRPELEDVA
jgi:hypothetical protein